MKICLIVSDFAPKVGGISTLNTQLARALAAHSSVKHVRVLSLTGHVGGGIEKLSPRLEVVRLPLGSVWRTVRTLWRELRKCKDYDVFHSPNIFPVGFLALIICKYVMHKPLVATFMGTDVLASEGSAVTHAAKGFVLRHADTIATISESTRSLVAHKYKLDARRIPVIYPQLPERPHVAAPESIRVHYGFASDDVVVLTVCNLVRRKGVDDLIRAIGEVSSNHVKLIVVGDGAERANLELLVQELKLSERVRFAGRVPSTEPYYQDADIFALASYFIPGEGDVEGLGIVFLEAEQHMLPVVGTRSGGIPEAMIENETGMLVAERDVPGLAKVIEQLAVEPRLRRRMGERGALFVAEHFSAEKVASAYVALYTSLLPIATHSY